jgi:hypothetical protein
LAALGVIIGARIKKDRDSQLMVTLIDCRQVTSGNKPNHPEVCFGNYSPGRYMWLTENAKPFKKIIPFRGYQGLFDIPEATLRVCRVCGCSEKNACKGGCYWIEQDLCSSCMSADTSGNLILPLFYGIETHD